MNQGALDSLRDVVIFSELDDDELLLVARQCKFLRVAAEHTLFREGDMGYQMYIIHEGQVQISLATRRSDGSMVDSTINVLYAGQSFGEMVLVNGIIRSATVTTVEPSILLSLHKTDFDQLCTTNPRIGYRVVYQIAGDLAYKLRSSNLLLRGTIRWQHNELGQHLSSA